MLILFLFGLHFLQRGLMFHYVHTFICSNMLNLENILEYIRQELKKHAHFKILSRDEVFTRLFFFFSSRNEISSLSFIPGWNSFRQKRVNSKRHFTIDRDDFIPGWNFTCKHPLKIYFNWKSYISCFIASSSS